MTTVADIIQKIEDFAPPHLAEEWDPIGLAIGDRQQKVSKMLVALDFDAATLQEAIDKDVDFIFTHHPAIFSPLKTLNEDEPRRQEYTALIRANVALYSAHTNIDAAENGMNDWLAEALGLERPYTPLTFSHQNAYQKLTYYASPQKARQPQSWLKEKLGAEVEIYHFHINQHEMKVEMILPTPEVASLVQKLYEIETQPQYHLTAIEKKAPTYGIGRVGTLPEPLEMAGLVERVKGAFGIEHLRLANLELTEPIQKVAVLGGSGEKYYQAALAQGADVYITGDISYHGAQDMMRAGLAFIDPGHFIEQIFVEQMTLRLKEWNQAEKWSIEVLPVTRQKDVFRFNQ